MNEAQKLVAQCSILGDEICTILENGGNSGENQWQLERHLADHSLSPNDRKKSAIPPSYSIMTRHRQHARLKLGRHGFESRHLEPDL